MNFNLKKPCKECPFSTKCKKGWLGEDRAIDIIHAITDQQGTFTCHKTDRDPTKKAEHCAGALILLEKEDNPNQMMRIAERIGIYNRNELDMESDVFDNTEDFIDYHSE